MNPLSRGTAAATMVLTAIFANAGSAMAQQEPPKPGYIHETINGRFTNIKCSKAFPDGNPSPHFIAWIDTTRYHGNQLSPAGYAIMNEQERAAALANTNSLNWPLMRASAAKYDTADADGKTQALKEMLAEAHKDMPVNRWDNMAAKCEAAEP